MKQHLYAFGSLCRGELDQLSDLDLLACIEARDKARQFDSRLFSVYTHDRLRALWHEGNPFAWHLHLEAKLVFSQDGSDFLAELGEPAPYRNARADCAKFQSLFNESYASLKREAQSKTFHLSCMFLAIRNFATCYSFTKGRPNFSRISPLQITPPVPIESSDFALLVRARVLSTRGVGEALSEEETSLAIESCSQVQKWMSALEPQESLS